MTKRVDGIWLVATLFALWGLLGLRTVLASDAGALSRLPRLAISILILVTAYGLFKKRPWTLRAYLVWAGLGIVLGLAGEVSGGTHWLVVIVAALLVTAVCAAMGLYIHSNTPDTD